MLCGTDCFNEYFKQELDGNALKFIHFIKYNAITCSFYGVAVCNAL